MFNYYMLGLFFVVMINIAVGFLSAFEEAVNIPFFLFTLLIAAITLNEIRKLKKKADQYDSEFRG